MNEGGVAHAAPPSFVFVPARASPARASVRRPNVCTTTFRLHILCHAVHCTYLGWVYTRIYRPPNEGRVASLPSARAYSLSSLRCSTHGDAEPYSKAALPALAATILLAAMVASASARSLSNSTNAISTTWTALNYSGGFGTLECEVTLARTVPSTIAKTVGGGLGSVTAANIPACRRGGATILRETLPWSVTYRNFAGTVPNITAVGTNLLGSAFRLREPTFGVTCLVRSTAESPATLTYNRETGTGRIPSMAVGGSIPCRGAIEATLTFSGTSSSVSAWSVTLI